MALQKTVIDARGQSVSYRRIARILQDFENNIVNAELAAYTDASYRDAEKTAEQPFCAVVFSGKITLPITCEETSRAMLYARIKSEVPGWDEAIDV